MKSPKLRIPDPENKEMQYVLRMVEKTRQNIFLTGRAGSGKSSLLRHISRNTKKKHVILAPTGIAALNAGGQTIHSFFKLPFSPIPPGNRELLIAALKRIRKNQKEVIRSLDLIIIDEVSMVRTDIIDAIDYLLRITRNLKSVPFGGVQMLFVGDLFQLEPVVPRQEGEILQQFYHTNFFYGARAFDNEPPLMIELKKVYRQTDRSFVELLDRIRTGTVTAQDLAVLNARHKAQDATEATTASGCNSARSSFNIVLTSRRSRADFINEQHLAQLTTPSISLQGETMGEFPESMLPSEMRLELKPNAQVIFIANDLDKRWVNGNLGRFLGKNEEDDSLLVELEDGTVCQVQRYIWHNIRYTYDNDTGKIKEEELGKFVQYPIRLAWAITIHKSQGLTFDKVTIDLTDGAFAAGQSYVAFSRCRSLQGMQLICPVTRTNIITRREVQEYYREAANEEQLEHLYQESHARELYTQAIKSINKGELLAAIQSFGEAFRTQDLLQEPAARRLFIQKLYQLERMLQKAPSKKSSTKNKEKPTHTATKLLKEGLQQLQGRQYHKAVKCFDTLLTIEPHHAQAMAYKGKALLLIGKYQDAIRLLQEAYQKQPYNEAIIEQLSNAYREIEAYQEAYQMLCLNIEKFPRNKTLLRALAEVAELVHQDEVAQACRRQLKLLS